ncbi:MAG TPA: response regulator [Dehalococcoidia bacterium]|nr:response regulator [Dehalococcoidia bacterium]
MEALQTSEQRLAHAQAIAHVGNWDLDLVEDQLHWSDEIYRMFGLSPATFEVTSTAFLERVHPDDRDSTLAANRATRTTGVPFSAEHRIVRVDGSVGHVRQRGEVVRDGTGALVRMVGTIQDITEHVELEEQLRQAQKLQAIGQLAGGVAHDFNNLLMVISGYADVLRESVGDGLGSQDIEQIIAAAARAGDLTRQLLAFSRQQTLCPEVVSVNSVLEGLRPMLSRVVREEIDLTFEFAAETGHIRVDRTGFEQLILNLVTNACDAIPRGGSLRLRTDQADVDASTRPSIDLPAGRYARLTVEDSGLGMDAATLVHIFEPFFTTKEPGKGTGLGLAGAFGFASQSGGYLDVQSEVGAGSVFRAYLPQALAAEAPTALPERPARAGHGTLLLVEDEETVREVIQVILRRAGFTVHAAGGGEAAITLFKNSGHSIDLLLTDIVMPEMRGTELARHLREQDPTLPVLFMSGYAEEARQDLQESLGERDAFLQKPVPPGKIVETVNRLLGV